MKLFGGSGDRKTATETALGTGSGTAGSAQAGREPPADLGAQAGRQKGKAPKEKKAGTPRQKGKRIAIIMAVALVLFACAAAAAVWFVRSPQATSSDKETGDKVDVSSLLNSGHPH